MSLTDSATRQAKATDHPYTLADSDGLSLAVSAQGSKSWHFPLLLAGQTETHVTGHLS